MVTSQKVKLIRGLSVTDAIAIVIGTIIGNGVFLKTATMAQSLGSPELVIVAWIFAGLLSLTGALTYAELGSMMPDAGGEYVYLKEGYGDLWAFLYGWMRFWIAAPGSIAASAVVAATFLSSIVDLTPIGGPSGFAVGMLAIFSALNCLSVATSGKIQSIMTLIKVLLILGLVIGIFGFGDSSQSSEALAPISSPFTWAGFGAAIISALWAYDGWCNLAMMAGEVKDPARNVPRSFILGMLMVLGIYLVINAAYFYALPFSEIVSSNSDRFPDAYPVAIKAAMKFLGSAGITILTAGFVISSIGSMNGGIMASSRVPYAMAHDGLLFKQLSFVHPKTHVPVNAILIQGLMSIALALSGTFDQLTNYVVFSVWIFYGLVTSVVFVMRRKRPDAPRGYRTLGYPVLPCVFIGLTVLLLINTIITEPKSCLIGLGFIVSGIPFYFYFKKKES